MNMQRIWIYILNFSLLQAIEGRLGEPSRLERLLEENERIHVLLEFKHKKVPDMSGILAHPLYSGPGLSKVNAGRAYVTKDELLALREDSKILNIEEDALVYPYSESGEKYPFGLQMIEADTPDAPWPQRQFPSTSACSGESFKIAIIDSGLQVAHPDAPCTYEIDDPLSNCNGAVFGLDSTEKWYDPLISHGTHVAGTIGAKRNNNVGVSGVLSNSDHSCFLIAQVFGTAGNAATSSIIEAVEWAVENGARVINMSLGGPSPSDVAKKYFAEIREAGVLVIAAAGNDGTSTLSYPASYESVISVGAVDDQMQKATFSQYNSYVDIAAPGVNILSTIPTSLGGIATVDVGEMSFEGSFMQGSPIPSSSGVSGDLKFCPELGQDPCEGYGHVCLIERGEITFEEKALNCELGGGKAAVIYNNVDEETLSGMLADNTQVGIPVIGISKADGESILQHQNAGYSVIVRNLAGYAYMSGTSMASPHVAGAVADIWSGCLGCTSEQVLDCVISTALDLGSPGRDDEFGNGLIQARDALNCLVYETGCCMVEAVEATGTNSTTTFDATTTAPTITEGEVFSNATQAPLTNAIGILPYK